MQPIPRSLRGWYQPNILQPLFLLPHLSGLVFCATWKLPRRPRRPVETTVIDPFSTISLAPRHNATSRPRFFSQSLHRRSSQNHASPSVSRFQFPLNLIPLCCFAVLQEAAPSPTSRGISSLHYELFRFSPIWTPCDLRKEIQQPPR